jgi:hypothetical protein
MAKTTIPGGYIETGSIDTASLADTSITADKLHTTLDLTGKAVTVATATAGDNDTTVASTAFVSTAIATTLPLAGGTMTGTIAGFTSTGIDDNATSTAITIDSSENVGIGTTSPKTKLSVDAGAADAFLHLDTDSFTGTYASAINFSCNTVDATNYYQGQIGFRGENNYSGHLFFSTSNSGTTNAVTERMRITSSGNVGIGTSSPGYKLEVASPVIQFGDSTDAFAQYKSSAGNWHVGANGSNAFAFYSGTYGSGTERMRIDSSGNLGIGETTPVAKLHVQGTGTSGQVTSSFLLENASSGTAGMDITGAAGSSRLRFLYGGGPSTGTNTLTEALNIVLEGSYASCIGIGTENPNSPLTIHGKSKEAALAVTNSNLANSSTALGWTPRGGRYLTSNGTNWGGDGFDVGIVIGSDSGTSLNRKNLGIVLHNEDTTNNAFSPGIFFGGKSASGGYNTAYGYIMGKRTGTGPDANWAVGELHIDVAGHATSSGTDTYMNNEPAWTMTHGGAISHTQQPSAWGHFASNQTTNGTGWAMGTMDHIYGMTYQNNVAHGYGLTVVVPGYYTMTAIGLYATSTYAYVGWCVNGTQLHHWHSNHSFSNHDFVSHVIHYCNAGDHITLENSSQPLTSTWGGNHSTFSVWKIG